MSEINKIPSDNINYDSRKVFNAKDEHNPEHAPVVSGSAQKITKKQQEHTPSTIQADTLFNFVTDLKYIIQPLKNKMLSPRFCVEDIRYLQIRELPKVAIPMKCFCDINLHRMGIHLYWYGYYGIAFSKSWGMSQGIQAVQYINSDSELRKDFTRAFRHALKDDGKDDTLLQTKLKDYALHQLMYMKPYDGKIQNRNTKKAEKKCFTDECEWRYVPDVTKSGYEQIYHDESVINSDLLRNYSDAIEGDPEISLNFSYNDVKYIIVKTQEDFGLLAESLNDLDPKTLQLLLSKVIIWDNSKGDF